MIDDKKFDEILRNSGVQPVNPIKSDWFSQLDINKPKAETGLKGFATGVGKGVLSTFKGASQLGQDIGNLVLPKSMEMTPYSEENLQKDEGIGKLFREQNLEAQGTAEKIGKTSEQVGEFFIPASKISKVSNVAKTAIKGSGFLNSTARVLAQGAIEGIGNAGVTLAQTGGDIKEAVKTALIAGGLKSAISGIGEVANVFKLPERLYSTIFKNSSDDMLQELKTGALDKWQKTNPEEFKTLVDKGIIKVGEEGKVILNETLAKEALDRGLKGSITNMANETVKNLYKNEAKAQEAVKNYKGTLTGKKVLIDIPEAKKLTDLLDEISVDYKNVGGSISEQADTFSKALKNNKLDGETALKLRRFVDGMRVRSAFNPGQKLSQTQQNFKYFADSLRSKIAKIPGMKETMNEYRFSIEALDTLAKEAAKQGNSQILSLIDSMLLSGGIAGGNVVASGASIVARRALKNAPLLTNVAQGITKIGKSSTAGTATRGIIGNTP